MIRSRWSGFAALVTLLVTLSMCGPTGMPMLSIEGPTTAPRDGVPINLRVVGSNADGTVATGSVEVKSDVGSLRTPVQVSFDEFGTARVSFSCDVAEDPDCSISRAILTATWTSKVKVTAELSVRLADRTVGDGGTGGGTGGGPAACGGVVFNRQMCTTGLEPGPTVACCRPTGFIPDCASRRACAGDRFKIFYVGPDGGTLPLTMLFTIPARPMNPRDCTTLEVGYRLLFEDGGFLPNVPAKHTYGSIEPDGKYFGLRSGGDAPALRAVSTEECTALNADGGSNGIWNIALPARVTFLAGVVPFTFDPIADAGAGLTNSFFFRSLY